MENLVAIFADTQHYARLRNPYTFLLGTLKNAQALPECCSSISNEWRQSFDGFDVMRIYIQTRFCDYGHMVQVACKVTGQSFNQDMGSPEAMLESAFVKS